MRWQLSNTCLKDLILGLETPANHIHTQPDEGGARRGAIINNSKNRWLIMANDRQNLQDAFLNQVRKTKIPVTVFLINGVKLQGVITWFDNFCILLRRDGQSQLVYKHAVSTIMPSQPVNLYDGDDAAES